MRIYVKIGNPKAVLVCIMEMTKQLEQENIVFEATPPWTEEILGKICRGCGIKQLNSLCEEVGAKRFPSLMNAIQQLKYWQVDGVGLSE